VKISNGLKNENRINGNETCEIYMNDEIMKKMEKGLKIIFVYKLKQEEIYKIKNDDEDQPKKSYMLKNNVKICIGKFFYAGFSLCK
jgi:hypothetical protein